jgi:single-strand selective monofunctional uracil DNA glycosylase
MGAMAVVGDLAPVGQVLHPSPASPKANRGWAAQADAELAALGLFGG